MALSDDQPLEAIMGAAVDAVIVIDDRGLIQRASTSAETLFGFTQQECLGKNISLFMPEPDRSAHDGYISAYLAGGSPKIIGKGRKTFGRTKSGRVFPMHLSVGQFHYEGRHYFIGICHDLSDYVAVLENLEASEKRYKDIINSEKHFICRVDGQLKITFANQSLVRAVGASGDELLGQSVTAILAGNDLSFSDTLESLFMAGDVDEISIKVALKSGDNATLAEWSFRKVQSPDGDGFEAQGLGIDVSEKEAAISRARYLSNHDQLTGLLKTPSMLKQMEQAVIEGQRFAFFHLDLKRFGQINQRFGRDAGDRLLVKISTKLRALVPDGSWIARHGGDEFLIACPEQDAGDAALQGRKFAQLFTMPWRVDHSDFLMDCKIAAALFPQDTTELSRVPEITEAALKDAKASLETLVFFDKDSHQSIIRSMTIEQALKAAILTSQLEIYLQPKINLASRELTGFEALLRWQHPDLGTISPGEFVPIAESAGLGPQLDRFVLRRVAELIQEARLTSGHCPTIAVNITAGHFSDSDVFAYLRDLISEFDLDPSSIELEITEGVILHACDHVSANFRQLRDLGVKISIDDFGTGYSSLSYLKRLDVDELKIDKTFVDDIDQTEGAAIVKAVIDVATALQLEITAEGVETQEQVRVLSGLGCTTGQGYYFSRPVPAREALSGFLEDPTSD